MLTDSGVNAMSDKQLVAMIEADDSYAGSATYTKLENKVKENGPERIAFVRLEAGTNQIGGQPISLENMKAVRKVCDKYDLMLVMDSSLLADNLYFIKTREAAYKDKSIREINKEISDLCDIIYFSARKLGHARGGGIITNSKEAYMKMRELIGGLKFVEEPKILRFFFGKLLPTDNWQNMLMAKYQADFGDSL